jgi:hypothetical protein
MRDAAIVACRSRAMHRSLIARLAAAPVVAVLAAGSAIADGPADPAAIAHVPAEGYPWATELPPDDVPGGAYAALACSEGRCRLEPARVQWTSARVDTTEGPVDGLRLEGVAPAGSIVLLRGIDGMLDGPVATEYLNPDFPLLPEPGGDEPAPLAWRAGDSTREIRLQLEDQADGACPSSNCDGVWTLHGDSAPVELARAGVDAIYESTGLLAPADFLVWAGDLDRDGRLDLIVRPQSRPDSMELRLLLGRDRATDGEWRAAASFYWWDPANPGC